MQTAREARVPASTTSKIIVNSIFCTLLFKLFQKLLEPFGNRLADHVFKHGPELTADVLTDLRGGLVRHVSLVWPDASSR